MKNILFSVLLLACVTCAQIDPADTVLGRSDTIRTSKDTTYKFYSNASQRLMATIVMRKGKIAYLAGYGAVYKGVTVDSLIMRQGGKRGISYSATSYYDGGKVLSKQVQFDKKYKVKATIFGKKDTNSYNVHEVESLPGDTIRILDEDCTLDQFRFCIGASRYVTTLKGKVISEYLYPYLGSGESRKYTTDSTMTTKTGGGLGWLCTGDLDRSRLVGNVQCVTSKDSTPTEDTVYRLGNSRYTIIYHQFDWMDSMVVNFSDTTTYYPHGIVYTRSLNRSESRDSTGRVLNKTDRILLGSVTLVADTAYSDPARSWVPTSTASTVVSKQNGTYLAGEQMTTDLEKKWVTTSTWGQGKLQKWRRNNSETGALYIYGRCTKDICSVYGKSGNFLRCTEVDKDGYYDATELPKDACQQ